MASTKQDLKTEKFTQILLLLRREVVSVKKQIYTFLKRIKCTQILLLLCKEVVSVKELTLIVIVK